MGAIFKLKSSSVQKGPLARTVIFETREQTSNMMEVWNVIPVTFGRKVC